MNEVASLDSKHADVVGPTSTANSEDLQLPEELIAQPGAEELIVDHLRTRPVAPHRAALITIA